MEERAIDRLRKFARYARDKGVVKGENSFEAYCELSNRYIYNSIRNGKGAIGTDIIARIVDKFPELMEILKKYDYVLPIISNQQYNLRLKIVADYAGLDRNLTVHMSRHTFATMCLNNGVKMENVSKMLGHTNVRTTQQYAKVLNAEVEKDFEMLERILS